MGGLASLGSSAIGAASQMAMQQQMLDNYWQQIERQAKMDKMNYIRRINGYLAEHQRQLGNWRQTRTAGLVGADENKALAEDSYQDTLDLIRGPSTDVYGGQRTYAPGLGFQYRMAPDILDMFRKSLGNVKRQIDTGNQLQKWEVPKAVAAYTGRKQYTPDQLHKLYAEDARLADWRERREKANALGLASVRGGRRSNWADKVSDMLAQDQRDTRLRYNDARRASIQDAIGFNKASDDQTFSNLANLLSASQEGRAGERFGEFADSKASNLSGVEGSLAAAISNIGPQMEANMGEFNVMRDTPRPENRRWEIKRPGEMEARPTLSV